jgi:hypothetical protein
MNVERGIKGLLDERLSDEFSLFHNKVCGGREKKGYKVCGCVGRMGGGRTYT